MDVPAPGVIYLGEVGNPGDFIVTINKKTTPYFMANSAFKAIFIGKAGTYRIAFRYWPEHLTAYLKIAILGLCLLIFWLVVFWKRALK